MRKTKLFSLMAAALLTATTAWADVNADDYKLPGAFSVSSTKVVYFSQGNLQYTKSTGKWKIMDHQYDMVETLSQNVGTNYASQDVVTLFGWGTSGWESDTRTADFPYYTNNNNADYGVLATKSASETLTDATTNGEKGDWGVFNSGDLGAGWRTLTNAEWGYLFNSRTPGNSVNGVSNARYTEATINTDGTAVNGIILFPDDAVMTSVSGVTWGTINSSSAWGTRCTTAGWTALETAGCVFLPAAGYRLGTTVYYAGIDGYYWSSTAGSASNAYYLYFYSGYVYPQGSNLRFRGYSVRLVSDEAPVTPATVTAAPTAISGLIYNGSAQALINAGTASGGTLNYSLDNTNWSTSIPTATDADDYTVYYKVVGDASHTDYTPSPNTVAVTINKADAVITDVPAAIEGLVYTGAAQTLISGGTAIGGELQYKVDASAWSTDLPTGTDASDYTVYYKVVGDGNHNGIDESSFNVTIAAPAAVIGDPNNADQITAFLDYYDGQNVAALTIDRPVLNNMYNTLCLPFDMNATQIAASSLNGVEIREFTGASVEGTTLNLSVGDPVNAVVAGRPYFVKYSAASQLDDLHFEDVTINNALLDNMAVTFDGVTFKGTFTPFVMPNGLNFQGGYLFLGQNNQLFWPNTSNPLKPFRAYFYVDVESSTPGNAPKYRGMPARIVEGKNVATGVENANLKSEINNQKFIKDGQLIIIRNGVEYNVNGQIVK